MKTIGHNTAKWVTGDKLDAQDQRHCLAAFVHRFTREHKPQWAHKPRPCGNPYPVQYDSDHEWLVTTRFAVKANGKLDLRVNRCESNPTWPDNPELRNKAA